jgi:hypothetical protein
VGRARLDARAIAPPQQLQDSAESALAGCRFDLGA